MELMSCSPPISAVNATLRCRVFVGHHFHRRYRAFVPSDALITSSASSDYFGVSLSLVRPSSRIPTSISIRKSKRSFYVLSGIFEKFTERAIKAVMFSQREAKALGKDMVFSQHLLLGLITEDRTPGGFLGSGITIEAARVAVQSLWKDDGDAGDGDDQNQNDGKGENVLKSETSATAVPFSPSTKRVFEAALEYSRTMGYKFIAPEHIAIGLFTVDDDSSNLVFKRLGVNVNHLAAVAVARLQGELAKEGREPPGSAFKRSREKIIPEKVSYSKSTEKEKDKKALDLFCVDLTAHASNGLIDPVIGRDTEVCRVIQILCRRTKSNPVLLGEAGVGKTAIAEGLAIDIAEGNAPYFLLKKRVLSLDIGLLMAGTKERGELEARVTMLIKEIKKSGNIILFIDEVHTLIGSGKVERGIKGSSLDIADLLKPALAWGEMQCIASTTMDEFRRHFENDAALARRFQPVIIKEPSQEDAIQILFGLREKYESYHKCRYTTEAIIAAVHLSARYISDRYLPDKAIDLIDEAGSKARMETCKRRKEEQTSILSKPPSEYWKEIRAAQETHEAPLEINLSDIANTIKMEVIEQFNSETFLSPAFSDDDYTVVGPEDIAAVASLWSGIPVKKLAADERMLLLGLDEKLKERVIGQDEAVHTIGRAVKRSRVGLKDPDRPIAAMLFCGPTGVGKTELTKALAASYFGSESAMLRLDMSEYMERHTVSKLIGSPPGYVGYGEGGTLTEAIRKQPFTVILLDEIEKAHPDVFNILLQLFEDGHLTDSQGRRVSFKNALVVMTSNVGSAAIAKGRQNAFGFFTAEDHSESYAGLKALVMEELKAYFRPELLNRIDEVVVFRPLEKPQILEILDVMVKDLKERLVSMQIGLEISEPVMNLICQQGYDRSFGARPLRRAVTLIIENLLSEAILAGNLKPGDIAVVHLDDSGNPVVTNSLNRELEVSDRS